MEEQHGFHYVETAEEWQELLRSDANVVRSREDWDQLISSKLREEILPNCDDETVNAFSERLIFRNGGLAGANYSMLMDVITYRKFIDLWKYFGIGQFLAGEYTDRECAKRATCSQSKTDICTDNC